VVAGGAAVVGVLRSLHLLEKLLKA